MIWTVAWYTAGDAARHDKTTWPCQAAMNVVSGAILALVVYDDAGQYLNMTSDQLRFWAVLSHEPAAVLLQPYVQARGLIAQLHSQEVMS